MKNRRRRRGLYRSHNVHARMYTTDFRSLLKYCIKTHQSISQALERSVINEMKNNPQVCYTWAETVAHLRMIQASIHALTAMSAD